MVAFVTFFLWLMMGVHPVEVAVDPGVVSVEILLDGVEAGVATAPRWRVEVDFGKQLLPHSMEAVARDGEGVELGRAHQLVNMPRGDAEVEILLEEGTPQAPSMVRVMTASVERLKPLVVYVSFNGRSLLPAEDGRFPLPPYDPRQMHLIGAEAYFPDGVTVRSDLIFGGVYGGKIATELTAVPIEVEGRRRPTVDELQGAFRVGGEALRVAAVDQVGGRVYCVRDSKSWPILRRIGVSMEQRNPTGWRRAETEPELSPHKIRFHMVVPSPAYERGLALFPFSEAFDLKRWTLPWLVTHLENGRLGGAGQKLATGVAVAGLEAAGDGNPRVVLLVSGDADDQSAYEPAMVRGFLKALGVPLVVWTTNREGVDPGWGEVEDVSTAGKLSTAARKLNQKLKRQWIVWVEGLHLPNRIELDSKAERIRLAG